MKAVRLRIEYLREAMGIDRKNPRIFWNCEGGIRQSAYRILCETDGGELLWDTEKRAGSTMRVRYAGKELESRMRVAVRVKLWDEDDVEGDWSEPFWFEMGLLEASDWQASWITGSYKVNPKLRYPVDCFRKKIYLQEPVRKARLYVTACGLYEFQINGKKAGDIVLAPGITDYRKRIHYQTIDVTGLLQDGENVLTAELADGWYRGSIGAMGVRNQYGTVTKLLAQLEVTFEDGSSLIFGTGADWNWSADGPVRFADLKDGEKVDARMVPTFSGMAKVTSHPVTPSAGNNMPVREHETFTPVMTKAPDGNWLLDFGQNIAGYITFRLQAHAGDHMRLRFGEMLDADGNLTLRNIQCVRGDRISPLQEVEYLCREGENCYRTRFVVFGFQYVEVSTALPVEAADFMAVAVYSDLEEIGTFSSSNPLLDSFVKATRWSAKNNSLDLPTDCPTRERQGWTGDAQIFFDTAAYLFDYAAFAEKYLDDIYDLQEKNGSLPQIAPYGGVELYMKPMNGSVGWADAGILIPYFFYRMYGDRTILAEYYAQMRRYAQFMIRRCGKWGGPLAAPVHVKGEAKKYLVNRGQSYGEWLEPAEVHPYDWKEMAAPHPEVSTAYTSYVMGVMEEIAELLGKEEDAAIFRKYHDGCKMAYEAMAELPEFTLDTDRQARLVRPLALDLLNESQEAFAKKRLIQAMEHYGWRLGTGFLSTPLIMDVLTAIDPEAAYRLLENEEMPGWLFMPKHGATTVWEGWEGPVAGDRAQSLNHYSKGAVCAWLFGTMCGIRPDCYADGKRKNHFTIAPVPGGHFTHAEAVWNSVLGEVTSSWERIAGDDEKGTGGRIRYQITVPANCTATLILPGEEPEELEAGSHERYTELP